MENTFLKTTRIRSSRPCISHNCSLAAVGGARDQSSTTNIDASNNNGGGADTNTTTATKNTGKNSTSAAVEEEQDNLISLRWNDSESFILSQIRKLWTKMELTDVFLACEGKIFKAHKLILTLWSPYFRQLFDVTSHCNGASQPVIVFRDTLARDLELLLQFMYQGQVYIGQKEADRFLKTAESLQIAGLNENIRRCTAAVISTTDNINRDESSSSQRTSSSAPLIPTSTVESTSVEPTTISRNITGNITALESTNRSQSQSLPSYEEIRPKRKTLNSKKVGDKSSIVGAATARQDVITRSRSFGGGSTSTSTSVRNGTQICKNTANTNETNNNNTIYVPSSSSLVPVVSGSFNSSTTTSISSILHTIPSHDTDGLRVVTPHETDMIFSQVMQMQEPIPIREVEEAVAAASASSEGQSLLLLSLNQSDLYQEQEIARDIPNINNNTSSGISPYASFILPDLDHQYTTSTTTIGDENGGQQFPATFVNDAGVILQSQQQHVTILHHHHHLYEEPNQQQEHEELSSINIAVLDSESEQEIISNNNQMELINTKGIRNIKTEKNSAAAGPIQPISSVGHNIIQFIPCPKCGKRVKEQSLKVHMKRSHLADGELLPCPICPKNLKSKGVYYKHMFVHRQRGEFPKKTKAAQKQRVSKRSYNGKGQKQNNNNKGQVSTTVVVAGRSTTTRDVKVRPGPSTSMSSASPISEGNMIGGQTIIMTPTTPATTATTPSSDHDHSHNSISIPASASSSLDMNQEEEEEEEQQYEYHFEQL